MLTKYKYPPEIQKIIDALVETKSTYIKNAVDNFTPKDCQTSSLKARPRTMEEITNFQRSLYDDHFLNQINSQIGNLDCFRITTIYISESELEEIKTESIKASEIFLRSGK